MAEMTTEAVRKMGAAEIAKRIRRAAEMQREHIAITWEHGTDLVNIVATHGDALADAVERWSAALGVLDELVTEIELSGLQFAPNHTSLGASFYRARDFVTMVEPSNRILQSNS